MRIVYLRSRLINTRREMGRWLPEPTGSVSIYLIWVHPVHAYGRNEDTEKRWRWREKR